MATVGVKGLIDINQQVAGVGENLSFIFSLFIIIIIVTRSV